MVMFEILLTYSIFAGREEGMYNMIFSGNYARIFNN